MSHASHTVFGVDASGNGTIRVRIPMIEASGFLNKPIQFGTFSHHGTMIGDVQSSQLARHGNDCVLSMHWC